MNGRILNPNWRGLFESSQLADGTSPDCSFGLGGSCITVTWPTDVGAYLRRAIPAATPTIVPTWLGSLTTNGASESRRLYRRFREYDPATGQFTQEDPIGLAGGLNLYGFANGDPVNFADPFGLQGCSSNTSEAPNSECLDPAAAFGFVLFSSFGRAVAGIRQYFVVRNALRTVEKLSEFASGSPSVTNTRLAGTVRQLFRPGSQEIPGGTAGAVRFERLTGQTVGGRTHTIKATQRIQELERILREENLNRADLRTTERLIRDLRDALTNSEEAMTRVSYDDVEVNLVAAIPELAERVADERKWWGSDKPGPHIIVGNILAPYVMERESAGDHVAVARALEFLERLAKSSDLRVQELAAFSFLELLLEPTPEHARLRLQLPAALSRLLNEVEDFHRLK